MIHINPNSRTLRSKPARAKLYLEADGICYYCGKKLPIDWQADHFIPWCKGGKTTWNNLRAACKKCNLKRRKKMIFKEYDYEQLNYFKQDFPNAKGVRTCQIGAYNCVIQRLVTENQTSCSIFLPTGTGKSDVARQISVGVVVKRKKFCGVWAFSPSKDLRKQLKVDELEECFQRINYKTNHYPIMEMYDLASERFRNGCFLESYTTQLLTTNGNVDLFIEHAKKLRQKTGMFPIAVFDESHLFSTDNEWGSAALKMQNIGIPIVLITGTPFRADHIQIPGFTTKPLENFERRFIKTSRTDDPLVLRIRQGHMKVCRYELEADYEYSYQRAWEDGIILKPEPRFVDATMNTYNEKLSKMSIRQSGRLLRAFLMDDRTIESSVADCIQQLLIRKVADNDCAAIVTTLSDENEFGEITDNDADEIADIHAKKIKREFERQAPELKILVVTSNTNSDQLENFKKKSYDVLIIKVMGSIGFNCKKIKTVLNLSNYRTLPAFMQLINRGCRPFGSIAKFDVIMPKDPGMVQLWDQFEQETKLVVEEHDTLDETEKLVDVINKDNPERDDISFHNHELSISPINDRDKNDEIIEMFKKKLPQLGNRMSNQEILTHFEHMATVHQNDWLEKLPDYAYNKTSRLLDTNEEESRLRGEANDMVREITNEIAALKGIRYDPQNPGPYTDVKKNVWTCLKRRCGFRPNQSMKKLAGIDNYRYLVNEGNKLKDAVLRVSDDGFDYATFLGRF
jgi:superfamily II DNA or RNA helicase